MHRLLTLIFASLLLYIASTTSAIAGWVEAKSDNFIFVGDTSEKKAKLIVQEMEEYRDIIFRLFNWGNESELIPMRIYGVKSEKDMKNVTGNAWASGIYTTSHEGPIFIANMRGGFGRNSSARITAYHEYIHHLVAMNNSTIYPLWYNEGMAEYLSTFEISNNGKIKIGLPSNGRAYSLANETWFDTNLIVNSVNRYPFKQTSKNNKAIGQFYAQSWLAAHYIQSTEGFTDKLDTYIQIINSQPNPDKAFDTAFGMSPDAFEKLLKAYYKKNRYKGLLVKMQDGYTPKAVTTRKLSKGEAQFHLGEAVRRYRHDKTGAELAESYYLEAIEKDGPSADITASRALVAMKREDDAGARALAEEAISMAPEDSRILQIAGHVQLGTYKDTGSQESKAQITKARKLLKKSMRNRPENIQAHFDYVSSYALRRDTPSKQAIFSAEECAMYYTGRPFVDNNLPVAHVLMEAGKYEMAGRILKQTRIWSETPYNRSWADRQLSTMPN